MEERGKEDRQREGREEERRVKGKRVGQGGRYFQRTPRPRAQSHFIFAVFSFILRILPEATGAQVFGTSATEGTSSTTGTSSLIGITRTTGTRRTLGRSLDFFSQNVVFTKDELVVADLTVTPPGSPF